MKSSEIAIPSSPLCREFCFLEAHSSFLAVPFQPFPPPFLLAVLYITHTNQYPENK